MHDIKKNKVRSKSMGGNDPYLLPCRRVIYHAPNDHIDVGIDPDRSDQDQNEPYSIIVCIRLIVDVHGAESERGELPGTTHDDDETVPFPEDECLYHMCECGEPEEYSEEKSRTDVRAEGPDTLVQCYSSQHLSSKLGDFPYVDTAAYCEANEDRLVVEKGARCNCDQDLVCEGKVPLQTLVLYIHVHSN